MEQWAELRREHFVGGKSIKSWRTRRALAQHGPAGAAGRAAAAAAPDLTRRAPVAAVPMHVCAATASRQVLVAVTGQVRTSLAA